MPSYLFRDPTNELKDLVLHRRKTDYQLVQRSRANRDAVPEVTTAGSKWLIHVKVFPNLCSFDGKYFMYHYISLRTFESFTVLCEPPFFRAHIIWRGIGTWTGGGQLDRAGQLHIARFVNERYMRGTVPADLRLVISDQPLPLADVVILPEDEAARLTFTPWKHITAPQTTASC